MDYRQAVAHTATHGSLDLSPPKCRKRTLAGLVELGVDRQRFELDVADEVRVTLDALGEDFAEYDAADCS